MIANASTNTLRHDRSALLAELESAGAQITKPTAIRCPFHEDDHPSAGVYADDGGVWRFQCQSASCGFGGDVFDVMARVQGRPVADVLREHSASDRKPTPKQRTPKPSAEPEHKRVSPSIDAMAESIPGLTAKYIYADPETKRSDMIVFRCDHPDGSKRFLQARPVDGGFEFGGPPKPLPLYNRSRIKIADTVVVVEGEKCVHALNEIGIIATTSPGGAGKAAQADWLPLAGKTVYLWPDADPPDPKTHQRTGIKHMREVGRLLEALYPPPRIFWVDVDKLGLPPKGDVVDFLNQRADLSESDKCDAVDKVLADAEPLGASAEVKAIIDDCVTGKRQTIRWPWPTVTTITRALLPGTVTLLCGEGGATKSFLLLEAAAYWHSQGIKVALLELEDGRAYHMRRVLAQRAGMATITDDEWVAGHADEAQRLHSEHAGFLDAFGRCLHEPERDDVSLADLAQWIDSKAQAGNRIICIDPITAADTSDNRWQDDRKFIMAVKLTAETFDVSITLITHPKKGRKGMAMLDDLSGGASYARFAQTVLWLERLDPPKEVTVRVPSPFGSTKQLVTANRSLRILKTRNAMGTGHQIAFSFDGQTLRLNELGIIVKQT